MRDISFFSEDTYLSIPNSKNPKVILAIGKKYLVKNSFKIYNPFSIKVKIFKSLALFFCTQFHKIFIKLIALEAHENSEFIVFLNEKYNTRFTASIYNATLKDKVVIQLQAENKVFGYVKFPMNEIGLLNIKNEMDALTILSEKEIIKFKMKSLEFHGTPFFILPELEGKIDGISDENVLNILDPFKKGVSFTLKEHKRVQQIKAFLIAMKLKKELTILEKNIKSSKNNYQEVYEHGDFAPWNIVKTKDGYTAFDFEYFTENGLEYFDFIKYHFQVGRLLKRKSKEDLFKYISQKINMNEYKEILSLYLLKEIMVAFKQQNDYLFEEKMLNYINE